MERRIITIEGTTVTLSRTEDQTGNEPGNGIWMTAWEIAELFNVTVTVINHAIKAVRKTDVLNDYEVCRYIQMENGLSADVYSLEIIIPVSFRLNTYPAHLFRSWIVGKVTTKEKNTSCIVFLPSGKGGCC